MTNSQKLIATLLIMLVMSVATIIKVSYNFTEMSRLARVSLSMSDSLLIENKRLMEQNEFLLYAYKELKEKSKNGVMYVP